MKNKKRKLYKKRYRSMKSKYKELLNDWRWETAFRNTPQSFFDAMVTRVNDCFEKGEFENGGFDNQ